MKYLLTIIVFLFGIKKVSCQSDSLALYENSDVNISDWKVDIPQSYAGVYAFGDSESESKIRLIILEDRALAQIVSGDWMTADGDLVWKNRYANLSDVRIQNDTLFTRECIGKFIKVIGNEAPQKALILNNTLSNSSYEKEIGIRVGEIIESYPGDFPQASYTLLSEAELKAYSSQELSIMRNEIFARYGYQFIEGGLMDQYFNKKDWYQAKEHNVTNFLTNLELENIDLIKRMEETKKNNASKF